MRWILVAYLPLQLASWSMASTQQHAHLQPPKERPQLEEPDDFSLVLGGPIFQLFRKSHLSGDGLQLLHRRILVLTLLAWLPLFLAVAVSSAAGNRPQVSFWRDIEVHVRFLVALPILVVAELIVHLRVRPVAKTFVDRGLVPAQFLPRFHAALTSAKKLRNSIPLELGLLALVYVLGVSLWNHRVVLDLSTWYCMAGGRWRLTPAGYWYVFVSIPIYQFLLLRWYFRLFVWFRFLWHVRGIKLNLIPTHPDRAGGLSFLGRSTYAFGPILVAQGAMLSALLATRILYHGESVLAYKLQAGGFVAFFVLFLVAPLLMFTPQLAQAKRRGLAEYGMLAQRYVQGFEQKWVVSNSGNSEELIGSSDIQSLADLANSYDVVREMRAVPFGIKDMSRLAVATAAPLVPLLLTIFSPEELFMRILKVVL